MGNATLADEGDVLARAALLDFFGGREGDGFLFMRSFRAPDPTGSPLHIILSE